MFWTTADIQEKLLEAKYFEVIKNYKLNIIFNTENEIKEIVKLINKEYPFLKINIIDDNKITIINEGAKKEGEEIEKTISSVLNNKQNSEAKKENLFSKLMEELIETELMEEIEELLIKKKYNIDKIFDNFINIELENWQIKIIKEIKNYLEKKSIKNDKIEEIIYKALDKEKKQSSKKENKIKLYKDKNNLYIFKKSYQG
jgi:hypothetical protein